jgi:hypothetical protein
MGINITAEHADMLVGKLGAEVRKKGRAHDLAVVSHNGIRVASFGIRHGSRRDSGHGHIPKSLHISPHECRRLATCTLSHLEWLRILVKKNLLPTDAVPEDVGEEKPENGTQGTTSQ